MLDNEIQQQDEQKSRKKFRKGVYILPNLITSASLFGGFDFQAMTNRPDWSIVQELRKQYDVRQVPAGGSGCPLTSAR